MNKNDALATVAAMIAVAIVFSSISISESQTQIAELQASIEFAKQGLQECKYIIGDSVQTSWLKQCPETSKQSEE